MLDNSRSQVLNVDSFDFLHRHIGPTEENQKIMLQALDHEDLETFVKDVVPSDILDLVPPLEDLPDGCNEEIALKQIRSLAEKNQIRR